MPHKKTLSEKQAAEIIRALDEAIANETWEKSNFLKVIGKSLQDIRDRFAEHVQSGQTSKQDELAMQGRELQDDEQVVYISLYSADGSNMNVWEKILLNLPRQVVSRPVYADELDVKNFINSKTNQFNEAYVLLYINRGDILSVPSDKVLKDRFGKPLLILKDRAINLEKIQLFIHASGNYTYRKGKLVKVK